MKNILLIALVLLTTLGNMNAQEKFEDKFEKAFAHLSNESYHLALPILLEMEEMNKKNYNTIFSIGNCYLHTAYEKEKAIPYFEKVLEDYKHLTIHYKVGNYKEKKAPIEILKLLGEAYHFEYRFEDALAKYGEYKEVLDPQNTAYLKAINRNIQITKNAMLLKSAPVEMKITGIEKINSEYAEYRPKVTGDENTMYFTSRRINPTHPNTDAEGKYYEDIYVSHRKYGEWQEPEMVEGPINKPSHDAVLYVSPDGQYMLLFRASLGGITEGGIYETKLEGDTWSEPTVLDADINSNYWETDVSVSADLQTMYFTSDRPGGQGGRDLWTMQKLPSGEWADVQNMGEGLNTEYDEEGPYLHPDGKTLYFSSKGHNTMGGYDVFKSEKQSDGTWGTPENIGYPINTTGDDVFYFPTNDGLRAYFSSFRKGGKGDQDIYILELPNFEPKTVAVYKGIAKYDNGDIIEDLAITVIDEATGKTLGIYRPNATTGRFLFILQPGQRYEVEYTSATSLAIDTVDVPESGGVYEIVKVIVKEGDKLTIKTGEVDDNDIISLVETEDPSSVDITEVDITAITSENTDTENTDVATATTENETNVTEYASEGELLSDLYFKYDRVILIDESEPDYSATLQYLKDNPKTKVKIEGHTDSHGSAEYNQWLSSARSNKIRNRLYDDGIAWGRMKTRGYGESKPILPNKNPDGSDNPDNRQKNRRVSFIVNGQSVVIDSENERIEEKKPIVVNDNYEVATVDISQEVVCMVQLGAFKKELDKKRFTDAPLEVAYYKDEDGLYKYLSGTFINKEIALEHRLNMIEEGYSGAFIVYFKDGKRLNQEEIALLYPTEDGIEIEQSQASVK